MVETNNSLICLNPNTNEVRKIYGVDTKEQILHKFEASKLAFEYWRSLPLAWRLDVFRNFNQLLEKHIDVLAKTLSLDMGKPLFEAKNEINGARERIAFFINEASAQLNDKKVLSEKNQSEVIQYEPLGTILNISAWNYPYLIGTNVFIPALIAGNAVIYKPSELVLGTAEKIFELLSKAGLPDEVFQVVIGDSYVGELLTDLPFDGVFFTGSYKTGQKIADKVGNRMISLGLELGSNDPVYITDAVKDVQKLARELVGDIFYNNGQSCCAVERLYVQSSIYKEFLSAFLDEGKKIRVGDSFDSSVNLGPLARKQAIHHLNEQLDDATSKGAHKVPMGTLKKTGPYFFQPYCLTEVNHEMLVMQEETFGPIIPIMRVENDEDAIRLMNDTSYGLSAGVYSDQQSRGKQILDQLNAGNVYLNCCDRVSPRLPFSGRKNSGFGLSLSQHGFFPFIKTKGWHLM